MTRAAYNHHETLTFPGYLDLETGKTLHAEPGGVYDVSPAGGQPVPEVPEPWFTPVEAQAGSGGEEVAPEAEPAAEPTHDGEPETGEPEQF